MRERQLKTILAVSISAVIVLAVLTILFHPRVRLMVQEWKYKQSGESEDLIHLCCMLVGTDENEKIYKYMPLAVGLEDFEESFRKIDIGDITYQGETLDVYSTYSILLTECIFSTIYIEKYDEYLAAFPTYFDELIQRNDGDTWWNVFAAQSDKITGEGYEAIIQSLEAVFPEQPELSAGNYDVVLLYLKVRTMIATAYFDMGDIEAFQRVEDENQRINDEFTQNIKNSQ